jgi:hypothetical protein
VPVVVVDRDAVELALVGVGVALLDRGQLPGLVRDLFERYGASSSDIVAPFWPSSSRISSAGIVPESAL